ncbi:mucin-22-like [Branchiostoma floridae]|uniref:Mucin-22-like n=1 Tax=Branchiostoma floridae TaxID=7739 RepID=A0A9J7M6N0_BRAFL|nr:mucin-22-like [Branchiostoma floridae]
MPLAGLVLAAVCQSTTTGSTTVAATSAASGATTASVPQTSGGTVTTAATAASGVTAAGSGSATNAGGSGTATTAASLTCLSCTGNETDECGRDVSTSTTTCSGSCWAYHKTNTTSNVITFIRGCGETGDTCTEDNKNEFCNTAGGIKTCRRCCTTNSCNDASLELDGVAGSGAADVHVSVVVTMASALFAILALW